MMAGNRNGAGRQVETMSEEFEKWIQDTLPEPQRHVSRWLRPEAGQLGRERPGGAGHGIFAGGTVR